MDQFTQLQASFNEIAPSLTAFDCERCGKKLQQLRSQLQAVRDELLPKKKFAFKRQQNNPTKPGRVEPAPPECSAEGERKSLPQIDARFSFVGLRNRDDLELENGIEGQTLLIEDLDNCMVRINGVCGNLFLKRIRNSRIVTKPVAGSIWIEECSRSDFLLICRQLRVHETEHCRLAVMVCSRPIIEDCTGLEVCTYTPSYPAMQADLDRAKFPANAIALNKWNEVEDFNHPDSLQKGDSPNWKLLSLTDSTFIKELEH